MDQSDRVPEASRHLSGGLEGVNFLHHPPEHPGGLRTKTSMLERKKAAGNQTQHEQV